MKIKLYDTSLEALEAVSCGDTDDLKQIKTALQAGDSESIKIIQKLSPSLISLFGKKPVNTLIDFIKDYEFEKAYELLLTLLEEKNNV
ncbi:MAG: hypothetical protein KAU21_15545 [Gammaproteobacteria bacterium]|nr:hypothetical protein [Gammaproteobacteria bacterium]